MKKTFSANVMNAFEQNNCTYADLKNFMLDFVEGNPIVDSEGNTLSKREANEKITNVMFSILGLSKDYTKRDLRRAMRDHGTELFDVIEEIVDLQIAKGWKENEFFNQFVDMRNIARGDKNEFWTEDDTILAVAKVAGNHHDISLQRLGEGTYTTIPTSVYAIAVGADIDRLLLGQEDFDRLIQAVVRAFMVKIQEDIYAEAMKVTGIPAALKGSGDLVKANFDQLLEDVSAANDNAPVRIIGTRAALSKLEALVNVNWIADSQKEAVAQYGRLGSYQGCDLIELPQRFANDVDFNGTQANLHRLVDNKLLLIVAGDDKWVKFVESGETEIYEVTEKGKGSGRIDDIREYAMQREMGVATMYAKYHGAWVLG